MTQEEFHKRYHYNPNTDCLGEGGFGKVYKAYDTHRDRWVAVKMAEVRPHLEEVRLKKEVELISKLPTHPNIAYYEECHTFSTFAGEYDFGILQYYELGNLQQLLTANRLTDGQKDSLLRQILEGIAFLHGQGIIHRDIKPQNILIVNRNGEYVPKITDFGISKKLDVNKSSVFTNSLAGAGTLSYASPEQLCGLTIKKNTDLWSFGVIVYWVFLGKLPFNTGNLTVTSEAGRIELFKQITKGEIPEIISQLNSPWNELVKKCLVANNEERLANSSECSMLLDGKTVIQKESKTIVEKVIPNPDETHTKFETEEPQRYSFPYVYLIYSIIAVSIFLFIYIDWDKNDSIPKTIETQTTNINESTIKSTNESQYDVVQPFHDGLAAVKKGIKWGYIDKSNSLIISIIYDDVSPFKDGKANVKLNGRWQEIDKTGNKIVTNDVTDKIVVVKEEEQVFIIVEEQASFMGGDVNTFRDWVTKNIQYPVLAAENGITGKVYVQYSVNSKGDVVDVKVVLGVDPSLDKEAVRVIMSSPKWEPGKQGGMKIKQQFTIPISFILQ